MPSANACKSNQSNRTTRCPHVILLEKNFRQIIDLKVKQFESTHLSLATKSNIIISEIIESENLSPLNQSLVSIDKKDNGNDDWIKCNECECNKNLWLCLKENCYFVGCGQDSASNKHSSLHAVVYFKKLI